MKKLAILIENSNDLPIVIPVKDFSLAQISSAFMKKFRVDENNLEYISSSMSEMIFGVKELTPSLNFTPNILDPNLHDSLKKFCHVINIAFVRLEAE